MRLAKAEVKRLFARRFTWVMLLVVVGFTTVLVVGLGADSKQRSPEVIAQAEQQVAEQRVQFEREQQRCEASVAENRGEYPPDFDCAQAFDPAAIDIEWFLPTVYSFAEDTGDNIAVVGFLLALLGFAVAASYIGAEWSSGALANLLLWRPRRLPVLVTKLAVVTVAVAVIGAVLLALLVGALYLMATVRGEVSGTTADTWRIVALESARALVLAAAAAAIGYALASIGRSTAMALGVSIGYVMVIEVGLQIVLGLASVTFPQRYLLSTYAFAWLQGGATLEDYSRCNTEVYSGSTCEPAVLTISMTDTVLVGGGVVAVLVGLAALLFVRRDVT